MADAPRQSILKSGRTAGLPVQGSAPGDDRGERLQSIELSLSELASDIRRVFGLHEQISDDTLLTSLMRVTEKSGQRARWLEILNSPLGAALSSNGSDVNTALGEILAALPAARS